MLQEKSGIIYKFQKYTHMISTYASYAKVKAGSKLSNRSNLTINREPHDAPGGGEDLMKEILRHLKLAKGYVRWKQKNSFFP